MRAVTGRAQYCQRCLSHFSSSCAQLPTAVPDGSKSFCLSLSLAAELEFVQIIIIVVVMMVMVVVITCLLNHYKLSARSFISRHSQGRRRDENLSSVSHTLLLHASLSLALASSPSVTGAEGAF